MHTLTFLSPTALLVACLVCRNLLQTRQRIFRAEPCSTSSTGLLCKQLPRSDIFSIFNTHLAPSFLSVKSSPLFPASHSSSIPARSIWSVINMPHRGVRRKWLWWGVRSTIEVMYGSAVAGTVNSGRHTARPNRSLRSELPGESDKIKLN